MRVFTKGKHLNNCNIWFESIASLNDIEEDMKHCDSIIIHGNTDIINEKEIKNDLQYSLISDLSLASEDILASFTKTIKNEINRSEREMVKCAQYTSQELLSQDQIVSSFGQMYSEMYQEKGIEGKKIYMPELKSYIDENVLMISCAMINEVPVVFHSYIYNKNKCRLLHSCSQFRVEDNSMRNAIGRANKYLHWKDMLWFKEKSVSSYDWGGLTSIDSPNGIDTFKMSFGGKTTQYYNIRLNCSKRIKIYSKIKSLISK